LETSKGGEHHVLQGSPHTILRIAISTLNAIEIVPCHFKLCLEEAMNMVSKRNCQLWGFKHLNKQEEICYKREGEENNSPRYYQSGVQFSSLNHYGTFKVK
jgi:hypothetical protein